MLHDSRFLPACRPAHYDSLRTVPATPCVITMCMQGCYSDPCATLLRAACPAQEVKLFSEDASVYLLAQSDGNLVLYDTNRTSIYGPSSPASAIWGAGTYGSPDGPFTLDMQPVRGGAKSREEAANDLHSASSGSVLRAWAPQPVACMCCRSLLPIAVASLPVLHVPVQTLQPSVLFARAVAGTQGHFSGPSALRL